MWKISWPNKLLCELYLMMPWCHHELGHMAPQWRQRAAPSCVLEKLASRHIGIEICQSYAIINYPEWNKYASYLGFAALMNLVLITDDSPVNSPGIILNNSTDTTYHIFCHIHSADATVPKRYMHTEERLFHMLSCVYHLYWIIQDVFIGIRKVEAMYISVIDFSELVQKK